MQLRIRSPRSRKVWSKSTLPLATNPYPYPPLDLRSEPVFLNGPPPGEEEPGQENRASHGHAGAEESAIVLPIRLANRTADQ